MSDRGVCIVAPPASGAEGERITPMQADWVTRVRRLADDRGYKVSIFRTVARTSQRKDESGRRLFVLEPWEADRLYKSIHGGLHGVFQAGQARVQLDPLRELSSANSAALARVVRYKAFFAQFDGSTAPSDRFQEFDAWVEESDIESPRDCRVLPLHMFAPSTEWAGLKPIPGREEFARVHGKPTHLVDEDSRPWKQPSALHGQQALTVANYTLPAGYHWDVNAARTESRLASFIERWRFLPGSYANVSPDGHIRGGQRKGVSASREGVAPRPPEAQPERASKRSRRQRRKPDGKRR